MSANCRNPWSHAVLQIHNVAKDVTCDETSYVGMCNVYEIHHKAEVMTSRGQLQHSVSSTVIMQMVNDLSFEMARSARQRTTVAQVMCEAVL